METIMQQGVEANVGDFAASHDYEGSGFEQGLAGHANVIDRMLERARLQPRDVYVTAVSQDGAVTTLNYGELELASRRLSRWLRETQGIRPREMVAFLPCNDIASVIGIYALLRAGAAAFLINPAEPAGRMSELMAAMPAGKMLCATAHVTERVPHAIQLPDPAGLASFDGQALDQAALRFSDIALCFGTSGSTAASKVVAQAHYNAAANAEALTRHHQLGPGTTILGCLPIHHVNGLHFTVFATLWSGATCVLLEAFSPQAYWQALATYRPTLASVVPSLLEMLLCTQAPHPLPDSFRYFVSAAAPLSAATCSAVVGRFGVRVNQGYGLTETTNFSTTMPPGLSDAAYRRMMIDAPIPSIGVALHGNRVEVLRDDGSLADAGESGEICMRGHNVMLGYFGNRRSTDEAFLGGWFHSGDLGYALDDAESGHRFFFITGRKKNIAKVMGVAVSLEEMERVIRREPEVADAVCFSVPDELLGEAVVMAVVSSDDLDLSWVHDRLSRHFVSMVLPIKVIQTDAVPRTATGKILRAQLPGILL